MARRQAWKPVTLKAPFLLSIMLASSALIVMLQYLLISSQRNNGIIFSANINELPLNRSFAYLYLPTIIAVIYSFLWSWIDLDAKRLEPFFQLSQDGGASAKDSLLLQYQFDTIALVPLKAIRQGHWTVFSASAVIVLVFWGVTPSQSGIFAVQTITQSSEVPMLRSTSYLTISQQQTSSTASYAQSVSNIAWLNETLPSFMTHDYALAPFGRQDESAVLETSEKWNAVTTLYSVDISCERPKETDTSYLLDNCTYLKPDVPPSIKDFSTLYVGYQDQNGQADYYLSQNCPQSELHKFLVQWRGRGWNTSSTTAINETTLYCEPTYYQQKVNATIALPRKSVVSAVPIGPKSPIPSDMFSISDFEWALSSGLSLHANRGDFPGAGFPDQKSRLQNMDVDLTYLVPMAAFAISAYQRPAPDYLDPELLRTSYQAAYRLLLARQMVNILGAELNPTTMSLGKRSYVSQAVVVVPAFAYVVEGLLGLIILLTAAFLYMSVSRPRKLASDPANLATFMSLVADQPRTLDDLRILDRASEKEIETAIGNRKYSLRLGTKESSGYQLVSGNLEEPPSSSSNQLSASQSSSEIIGVRPKNLRMLSGFLLFTFQLSMLVLFAILFWKAEQSNGFPLPSSNRFIRQLVENYIPTAVATFMEPVWVVLNRFICILQPFEELRHGKALASKSLTVDYTSLPPQLVFWKSFRAGHIILTAVCFMALLANLLTISFSGIFFEDVANIPYAATFSSPYIPLFDGKALNNTDTTVNRTRTDQFAIIMSNLTAGTPLPSWTDDRMFYLPFNETLAANSETWQYEATTQAFGAELECVPLLEHGPNSVNFKFDTTGMTAAFNISMTIGDGVGSSCTDQKSLSMNGHISNGTVALELVTFACQDYMMAGWIHANTSALPGTFVSLYETDPGNATFYSIKSSFMGCRANLKTGTAKVIVDAVGRVQETSPMNSTNSSIKQFLVDTPSSFIQQVHNLLNTSSIMVDDSGDYQRSWHNDSFPSDFYHYLIEKATNSNRLLDPALPVPLINETGPLFEALYSKLFAVILSTNAAMMLPAAKNVTLAGVIIKPETRIFMSKPMFIIAETILGMYVIVTAVVFSRRPWRIPPRMPTSIASIVAYFAASYAVQDLAGMSGMSTRTRNRIVERMDNRYGFGTFIGRDGKVHVGIEKAPFCASFIRKRTKSLLSNDRTERGSPIKEQFTKIRSWKKERYGTVQEGGWI